MARLRQVKSARKSTKDRTCRICRQPIEVGQGYVWWANMIGGRGGPKQYVHSEGCRSKLRRSAYATTSDKIGRIWDAQDDAESAVASASSAEEIEQALREAAETVEEVAQEYRDSADSIRESFSESQTADECEERADELDDWKDQLESAADDIDEFEFDDSQLDSDDPDQTEEEKAEERETAESEQLEAHLDEQREKASDALSNCPL